MNLFKKSFEVNGWMYQYTKTGVEITNPQGQKVGRPVPLPDIPIGKKRGGWSWFIHGR